ncbi:C1 family peptidase [Nodosilinea sp. E11]|uniref:C1 family peptidase n=1 Tax=Nodosilinea sp. E11 TaxID=3037479 RepID=UPI0029353211|nr:C1 family peptidase [Nodosilinea sp. E11]WOD39103.1 C1 family peptidase [Nodosilinea sp. E11]
MAQSNSSSTWQKKGFGWIPDLPDIADPSLTLALDNKPRLLSQEGSDHLEGIAKILSILLKDKGPKESKKLEDIYNQILGETRFPNVRVYKILRKQEAPCSEESEQIQHSQAKEIIQLKQALYWYYRELIPQRTKQESTKPVVVPVFFSEAPNAVLEWLQTPRFDDKLEEIVKLFQGQNQLVDDGIVGLRTYTALKANLANKPSNEQNVELLCPSSIIPHDILEEVFQQLTYTWLRTKFSISIDQAFEYFFGQYSLSQHQGEYATKIKIELQSTVQEKLKEISSAFRKKIKLLPSKLSGRAKLLHEKAIKDLALHEKAVTDLVTPEEAIEDLVTRQKSIEDLYEEAIKDLVTRQKSIENLDFHKQAINDLYEKAIKDLVAREKSIENLDFHKQAIKNLREAIESLDFHKKAIEDLKKKLTDLKDLLVCKSSDLTIVAYQELDRQFQAYPHKSEDQEGTQTEIAESFSAPQPVSPIFKELNGILRTSLDTLNSSLCGKKAEKEKKVEEALLENSFIIYSDEDFIEQFHYWFHIIEPFVSAIFQILSPLANFDNYRQAIDTGFAKLDGCFQFHQSEHASKATSYENFLFEYSPTQTSDQIAELQELRKTITSLFQETIAKINRIRSENLDYRPYILSSLENFLKSNIKANQDKKEVLAKKWKNRSSKVPMVWLDSIWSEFFPAIKDQLSRLKGKEKEKEEEEQKKRIRALSVLFIRERLGKLADELSDLPPNSEIYKFVEDELAEDKKNIDSYFRFFDFLGDIISEKYGVCLKNVSIDISTSKVTVHTDSTSAGSADVEGLNQSHEQETVKDKVDLVDSLDEDGEVHDDVVQSTTQAELVSFLTFKKELFEIQDVEDWGLDTVQMDRKDGRALFFEPTVVQLPINTNLMEKADRQTKLRTRPSDDAQVPKAATSTKFYFFLPGLVDLSYWCPPIEDQEDVNACTAFAGVSLLEYFAQKRYGKYTSLSARFLYKTARNLMNRSDDTGASVRQTMKALVLFGVPPEEVWPWRAKDFNEEPPAFCYAYAQSYQALKYFRLDAAGSGAKDASLTARELLLFQIKAVLAAGLPCIFGFTIYSSFFKDRNIRFGYIPYPSSRDQIMGGHTAVAVGYNDHKCIERIDGTPAKPGAILIRNSWGPSWGNGGYGWMPYEYILDGLTADWWSLLKAEWFDGGAFGLGAVDPGSNKPMGSQPVSTQPAPRRP